MLRKPTRCEDDRYDALTVMIVLNPASERTARAWRVGWAPVAVVGLHSALAATVGHRRDLDPVFHFLGGAAGAFAVLNAIVFFPRQLSSLSAWNPRVVAIAAVVVAALLWECGEFAADRVLGTHVQAGWLDTSIDLVLGTVGAAVVIVIAAFGRRHVGGTGPPA